MARDDEVDEDTSFDPTFATAGPRRSTFTPPPSSPAYAQPDVHDDDELASALAADLEKLSSGAITLPPSPPTSPHGSGAESSELPTAAPRSADPEGPVRAGGPVRAEGTAATESTAASDGGDTAGPGGSIPPAPGSTADAFSGVGPSTPAGSAPDAAPARPTDAHADATVPPSFDRSGDTAPHPAPWSSLPAPDPSQAVNLPGTGPLQAPVRRSLTDEQLMSVAEGQDAGQRIEQLTEQLQLREQEARDFSLWEARMLALGTPEAFSAVRDARTDFSDLVGPGLAATGAVPVIPETQVAPEDLITPENPLSAHLPGPVSDPIATTSPESFLSAPPPPGVDAPSAAAVPPPVERPLPAWDVPPPSATWNPVDLDDDTPVSATPTSAEEPQTDAPADSRTEGASGTPLTISEDGAPATDGTAPATDGTAPATEGTAPATEGTAPATGSDHSALRDEHAVGPGVPDTTDAGPEPGAWASLFAPPPLVEPPPFGGPPLLPSQAAAVPPPLVDSVPPFAPAEGPPPLPVFVPPGEPTTVGSDGVSAAAEAPDLGQPDEPGLAETGFAETGFAETGFPEAELTEAELAEAELADAGNPEPSLLDAEVNGAEVVDAEVVDAEVVDAEVIDAEVVDPEVVNAEVIDAEPVETPRPTSAQGGGAASAEFSFDDLIAGPPEDEEPAVGAGDETSTASPVESLFIEPMPVAAGEPVPVETGSIAVVEPAYEEDPDDVVDETDRVTVVGGFPTPLTPPSGPIATVRVADDEVVLLDNEPVAASAWSVEQSRAEPTPLDRRVGHAARLFWLWFAANASVISLALGATIFAIGMSLRQSIVAVLAGVALSFIPLGLTTLAGKRSGQPTMVVSRATFGHRGNVLPSAVAVLTRSFWGGVMLWLAASAVTIVLVRAELTAGLSEGVVLVVSLVVLFGLALVVAMMGYWLFARVQLVLSILAGVLVVGFIVLTAGYINIEQALSVPDASWLRAIAGAVLVFSVVGLVWANSGADLARFQRPESSGGGSMLWATFGAGLPAFVLISYGALLAASNAGIASGFVQSPLDTLALMLPAWYPVPLIAATVLSLLSGVIITMYSGAFALLAAGVRAPRPWAVVVIAVIVVAIAGLIGFAVPGGAGAIFRDVATTLAVPTAAWAGIVAAEMMIRNRRFESTSLLTRGGVYSDWRWGNLVGFVVITAIGFGLTTASVSWLAWQGYLFDFFGVPLDSDLAATDLGVVLALGLGILLPIVAGIPGIRRQEEARL